MAPFFPPAAASASLSLPPLGHADELSALDATLEATPFSSRSSESDSRLGLEMRGMMSGEPERSKADGDSLGEAAAGCACRRRESQSEYRCERPSYRERT